MNTRPLLVIILTAILLAGIIYLRNGQDSPTSDNPFWNEVAFLKEIRTITPEKDSPFGSAGIEYIEEQFKRKLTAGERTAFERKPNEAWQKYEDEIVSFEYPNDPLINVEAVLPENANRLRIVGGAVSTNENRFEQAYRITVGGDHLPYGILLVSRSDWLDEGLCMCGPIALKRLVVRDGLLVEFSLLPSGEVKKAQVLSGNGHRAVLFEWTHSVIPQSTYARIADSIRLKSDIKLTREDWLAKSKMHRNGLELRGWISPGDSSETIIKVLGEPNSKRPWSLNYSSVERLYDDGSGLKTVLRIPIRNGRFTKFGKNSFDSKEISPAKGTAGWAIEIAESNLKWRFQSQAVFDAFVRKAPKEGSSNWNLWCEAIRELHKNGKYDKRVLPPIAARFNEPDLDSHYAAWVLHKYKSKGRDDLFAARLALELKQATEDAEIDDNLFSFLSSSHPQFLPLVRQALAHPSTDIQASALLRGAEYLPLDEARQVAREKSNSKYRYVRSMTESLYREIATAEDLPDLKKWRDRETDHRIRHGLGNLIKKLTKETN